MGVCLLILYICSVAIFFPWSLVIFHILLLLFFMLVVSLHGFCATSFWTISHLWMGWVPTEQLFLRDVGYSGARIRFCINSSSSNRVGNLTRQGHLTKLFKLFLLPRKQWSTIARLLPSQGHRSIVGQVAGMPLASPHALLQVLKGGSVEFALYAIWLLWGATFC